MKKIINEMRKLGIKPVLMATLILGLALPVLVLATMPTLNTPLGGYRVDKGRVSEPVFYVGPAGTVYDIGTCVYNKSAATDYFVPTGTYNDWQHFFNAQDTYLAGDLDLVVCCGDNVCVPEVGGVPAETCSNCPQDCGECSGGDDGDGGGDGGGDSGTGGDGTGGGGGATCWGFYVDGAWLGSCGTYS